MPKSGTDVMLAVASCNTLLEAIDNLEGMVDQLSDPINDRVQFARLVAIGEWIGDARETVLDIKSRL